MVNIMQEMSTKSGIVIYIYVKLIYMNYVLQSVFDYNTIYGHTITSINGHTPRIRSLYPYTTGYISRAIGSPFSMHLARVTSRGHLGILLHS